jgi:polynucleotide 5'-kinase involved in rRNA processing
MKTHQRRRISFIKNTENAKTKISNKPKRKRSLLSDISNLSNFDKSSVSVSSDDSSLIDLDQYYTNRFSNNNNKNKNSHLNKLSNKSFTPGPILLNEIINIYDNPSTKEKIYLLKNDVDFCMTGSGVFRLIYGNIKVFGYDISYDNNSEDFDFDISEHYTLYTCTNKGEKISSDQEYEKLISLCNSFTNGKNNIKLIKEFFFKLGLDKISIVYFNQISDNFKILNKVDLLSNTIEYVDFKKYDESLKSSDQSLEDIFEENKKILICGKKNSGKSTYLHFVINSLLSNIKNKNKLCEKKAHSQQYLFFIDCDSGQPLLSPPYCVSFIKINKPLFRNYYKEISNKNETPYDIIRSLFVEETTPSNNFEEYLDSVKNLSKLFHSIESNENHYLVVNTNGYTSGLGNVINCAIIDVIKPAMTFYVKNKRSGRLEKGEEFENFILREEEKNNLSIILRKYKVCDSEGKGIVNKSKSVSLENKSLLIENDFLLKEEKNLKNKNRNKNIYIFANMLGERFSLNEYEKMIKSQSSQSQIFNLNLNNILDNLGKFNNFSTVGVSFDHLIFSFNFNEYSPKNELDILFSINAKMCFLLQININELKNSNNSDSDLKLIGNSHVLDISKVENKNKIFFSFAYVYNIDIIERKVYLISDKIDKFKNNLFSKERKLVLYRNNSTLDKNIQQIGKDFEGNSISSNIFEKLLIKNKFDSNINLFKINKKEENKIDTDEQIVSVKNKITSNFYFTRNKYELI